jgi:hypothetical protein
MYHEKHASWRTAQSKLALFPAVGALALVPVLMSHVSSPVPIHPGDNLTSIAKAHHVPLPALEAANPHVQDHDLIYAGQLLNLPGGQGGNASSRFPVVSAPTVYNAPASTQPTYTPPPSAAPQTVQQQAPGQSFSGGGGFQSCVIARESGGNSQVTNASGHYGLYQFSASTWAAYGGSPSSFGNASVAQQNQVFATAMATPGGASNWAPYDGC